MAEGRKILVQNAGFRTAPPLNLWLEMPFSFSLIQIGGDHKQKTLISDSSILIPWDWF